MGNGALRMITAGLEIDVLEIIFEDSIKLFDPVPLGAMMPRHHWCTVFDLLLQLGAVVSVRVAYGGNGDDVTTKPLEKINELVDLVNFQ